MMGIVTKFDVTRGFGFIRPDDNTRDVFIHFTGIIGSGFRTLNEGEVVSYDLEPSDKGPRAVNVSVIG